MIARTMLVGLILILPAVGLAEETAKESEAARRQRLEDLEHRIRALEQQQEMKEPQVPAPDVAPAAAGEK